MQAYLKQRRNRKSCFIVLIYLPTTVKHPGSLKLKTNDTVEPVIYCFGRFYQTL